MKQIRTIIAAVLMAMAITAGAQTTNYVHVITTNGTVDHYRQDEIASMKIDMRDPAYVTFTHEGKTVKVAPMNLGATSIADGTSCYGDLYAWGATVPFGKRNYNTWSENGTVTAAEGYPGAYSNANTPYYADNKYNKYQDLGEGKDGLKELEAKDDAVTANKGDGWRMPTADDFNTLYAACGGTGTVLLNPPAISSGSDYVKGMYWIEGATSAVKIGDDIYRANGLLFVQDADTHVFFPAAGNAASTEFYSVGRSGSYWSSTLRSNTDNQAHELSFHILSIRPSDYTYRPYGQSIRPIKK